MLRLTQSVFRGQVLRAHGHTDTGMLCVWVHTVCLYAIDMEPVMWRSDHDPGPVPWGIISNCVTQRPLTSSFLFGDTISPLRDVRMSPTQAKEMIVTFCFSHSDVGCRAVSISQRQGVTLSEQEPGLSHTWMSRCTVQGPWKSVWVISCQRRGEQQQIGLLKQFSSTGGLLSGCQESDYSIQLFCCSQSTQRAPKVGPHSYLSIPDTGINSASTQRWYTEGYRKCNLLYQHLQLWTNSHPAAKQRRL